MKYLLTIALTSTCLFSFGQANMFWNNYSNFNPAMSGFQHELHGALTYRNRYPSLSGNYAGLYGNVGANIASHHGVGIVYSGEYLPGVNSHKALLNYNYQFHFKKAGKLALGTGVGFGHITQPINSFELNLGAAYNWKNLYVGFSATNLTPPEQNPISSYYAPRSGYNFHAEYTFQLGEKFQLTQRLLYAYQDGFHRLEPNLTLAYDQRFSLGVSYKARDAFGINTSWNIKKKFLVAYSYDVTISKLNNGVSGGSHEFTLGYFLKNKSVCHLPASPR